MNNSNEKDDADRFISMIKRWFSAYVPDRKKEPRWAKMWMVIQLILVVLILLSAWECYNMRVDLHAEQTKQYVSCPTFTWNGTGWKFNASSNMTEESERLLFKDKECTSCLFT